MNNHRGRFIGRILFVVILVNVLSNVFIVRGNVFSFSSFYPYLWVGLLMFGIFASSAVDKTNQHKVKRNKEEHNIYKAEDTTKKVKSEYDFDDEFAIDPRDYE